MNDQALLDATQAWLTDDPDPTTRAGAQVLLDAGDINVLREHFGARLQFGTAGIRGALGPGPNRMNRAIVRRVTAGLGDYLLAEVDNARDLGVVIGRDGRHGSLEFAGDAAAVLGAKGIRVWLYDEVCPTPELAHAVTHLGAAAGIMVTASHNPPADNGYKAYWGNGAQIIPPHDTGISAAIDRIGPTMDIPLASADAALTVPPEVLATYLDKVAALRVHDQTGVRVVYTAMHGVGKVLVEEVLTRAGHTDLHIVPEQADPDPDFPTVSFPNPEEPGALDLAFALATKVGADLIIANDPDADRLAVAIPDGDGGFVQLSGNQVGLILAADLLAHTEVGRPGERLVSTTIVSSSMLRRIAAANDASYAECLTGFKWIANAGLRHEAGGGRFIMGYEEALGYSVGPVVRDKDGVSAALLLVDLAAWAKSRGETLLDPLHRVYRQYGYYASAQKSLVHPGTTGAAKITAIMDGLRASPPASVGGHALTARRDLLDDPSGEFPPSNVLVFQYGDDVRILARPSGTEPKIKFYFEVREPVAEGEPVADAEARGEAALRALMDAWQL